MKYKSCLRYPGGKSKAIGQMLPHFPASIPFYREPFLGGASVYLALHDRIGAAWLNDANANLMSFWKGVKKDARGLADSTASLPCLTPCEKLGLYNLLVGSNECTPTGFFFLNRVTFSGTTESGGYSKQAAAGRLTENSIQAIANLAGAFDKATLTVGDYASLLEGSGAFIYLDPPYILPKTGLYGKRGDLHKGFNHEELAEKLKRCHHQWLLSYDDCPQVRELYKGFEIVELPGWKYGNGKDGKELLIRGNYDKGNTKD